RRARARGELAAFAEGALERADYRGADGDDGAAGGFGRVERGGRLRGHLVALDVHDVLGHVVDAHRREGAGADVERDRDVVEAGQHLVGEVQARRRRRDRAGRAGEDGLVALSVVLRWAGGAIDVRRQRQLPPVVEDGEDRRVETDL